MKFKDYGKVVWFEPSKGFGMVETCYHGSVLIFSNDIIDYKLFYKNIADKYVFIGRISETTTKSYDNFLASRRNINLNQKRLRGYNVSIWVKDNESFYETIYEYWLSKLPLKYNKDIRWLISRCSLSLLQKIIDSNHEYWSNCEIFLSDLYSNSVNKNQIYKNYAGEYFLNIWKKSEIKNYDENLASAIDLGDSFILEKALEIDYKWIKAFDFAEIFRRTSDFAEIFNHKDQNRKTSSFLIDKVCRIDKNTIFNFLINKISSKKNIKYDDDIKWIVTNGNGPTFLKIIELKSLYSDRKFVSDIRKSKERYSSEDFAVFLYNLWIEKGRMSFNNDVKWILRNGSINIVRKIVEINNINWINNEGFVSATKKVYLGIRDFCFGNEQKKDILLIFEEFIYSVWRLNDIKLIDKNLRFLIVYGTIDIIKKIIKDDREKLLVNTEFIDLIIISYTKFEFKEDILIEACLLDTSYKYNKIVKWLFENCSVDKIKFLLNLKFGYDASIVDKIYSAFFPMNNIKYFKEKAEVSDWSYYFKKTYVKERETETNKKFKNLFLNEIEKRENKLTQKRNTRKETHAATDLANFVFCPASYVINQKYNIDIQEQENVFIGNTEHEKLRLLRLNLHDRIISEEEKQRLMRLYGRHFVSGVDDNYKMSFKKDNEFFHKIKNSKCISQGHKDNDKAIYYSKTKKLSGIPDYIFQDNNKYFAVEEKYTFKKHEDLTELYDSHKVQALAYLYGLDEFQFNEVYVLYWYIKKIGTNDNYYVYNYRLFKLIKSKENKEIIINAFNNVESIQKRIPYPFPPNRINYNKCVRCNYFPFCEHKKGSVSYVNLPALK
jgi:hypothetical protein